MTGAERKRRPGRKKTTEKRHAVTIVIVQITRDARQF